MARRIGMGLVGPEFIAQHHIDAVRRLGDVDVVAIAGSTLTSTRRKAEELKVGRSYATFEEPVNDPAIDVVHNTTPTFLHVPVTLAALRAKNQVLSDKPLAMKAAECAELRDAAAEAGGKLGLEATAAPADRGSPFCASGPVCADAAPYATTRTRRGVEHYKLISS
jgi:predicted dehydrogenase